MKKVLFLVLIAIMLFSCGKDDNEAKTHTVMVNISYSLDDGATSKLASPSLVRLYKEKASEFDFEKSVSSMANSQTMTLKNGSSANYAYSSDSFSGVNTIADVESGNYTVIAFYKPDGYSFSNFYYFGYKEIAVSDLRAINIVFLWNEDNGKFVQK